MKIKSDPKICIIMENKLWCEPNHGEENKKCRYVLVSEKEEAVLVCPPKKVHSFWRTNENNSGTNGSGETK